VRYTIVGAALLVSLPAAAEYPERPIRLIVASAPGGQPDINARMFAVELGKQLKQQMVVDNRSGATGVIGYEMLAKSAPDGHTMIPNTSKKRPPNGLKSSSAWASTRTEP
jgi:tripartite-type tricarboxylate transporter receptor subunit TctC